MPIGNIAGPETIDTTSYTALPTVPPYWVATPIGGPVKECEKIKINVASSGEEASYQNAIICDTSVSAVAEDPYPEVPATPQGPPCVRGPIVPTKNLSVYFEGQLVVVGGDAINGVPGVPNLRVLTEPTSYPKIIIGTNPL